MGYTTISNTARTWVGALLRLITTNDLSPVLAKVVSTGQKLVGKRSGGELICYSPITIFSGSKEGACCPLFAASQAVVR